MLEKKAKTQIALQLWVIEGGVNELL